MTLLGTLLLLLLLLPLSLAIWLNFFFSFSSSPWEFSTRFPLFYKICTSTLSMKCKWIFLLCVSPSDWGEAFCKKKIAWSILYSLQRWGEKSKLYNNGAKIGKFRSVDQVCQNSFAYLQIYSSIEKWSRKSRSIYCLNIARRSTERMMI